MTSIPTPSQAVHFEAINLRNMQIPMKEKLDALIRAGDMTFPVKVESALNTVNDSREVQLRCLRAVVKEANQQDPSYQYSIETPYCTGKEQEVPENCSRYLMAYRKVSLAGWFFDLK
jgi:hypothetical protein